MSLTGLSLLFGSCSARDAEDLKPADERRWDSVRSSTVHIPVMTRIVDPPGLPHSIPDTPLQHMPAQHNRVNETRS
jgi:hypothetical protein